MTTLEQDREALRRRQSAVLEDLLRGRVPPGFDPLTSRVTSRVLLAKRRRAAVRARPLLADVPDIAEHFTTWVVQHPVGGCGHEDADAFLSWVHARRLLPRDVRHRWRAAQVDSGVRSVAWVRLRGRRVLVLGVGSRYLELAVRPARDGVQERGSHA